MKRLFVAILALCAFCAPQYSQTVWSLSEEDQGIVWSSDKCQVPYNDHIEMSGDHMAAVLRWGVDEQHRFVSERSLVFPMLRTVPNNTHASLMHRVAVDVPSLLCVNGLTMNHEQVEKVEINGCVKVSSVFSTARYNVGAVPAPSVHLDRIIFPSTDKQLLCEIYTYRNISSKAQLVYIPDFSQTFVTPQEKGVTGSYIVRANLSKTGTFTVEPGAELEFGAYFQAYRVGEQAVLPDLKAEWNARQAYLDKIDSNLILETPDKVIDREFRFAKIRASESIIKTAGGYMHAPGGESYYAALWANDQAEYVNPFFPYLGYNVGDESALNSYMHFARFMNDEFKPIPSSIIAEGLDIWDGAGDRGDAAMIAHGASRYALAKGSRTEAEQLWPLISWCLEYCHRKLNADGVVLSDSDELEGRFPSGDANLCTSTLYYDALVSSAMLAKELGKGSRLAATYNAEAAKLAKSIEKYFGADVSGFHTYRYYDGNTVLRSWICMPLIVGLKERTEGTIAALTSPLLLTENGLLTEQGSETFWDRSTLYSLRGIYIAGDTKTANDLTHFYSEKRLLGTHVPYPIEAWPEGSQRHLSAESGLYCRALIEGMFGLRPTGLRSFTITPRVAEGWDKMALRHIRAFESDFDIEVVSRNENLEVTVINHTAGTSRLYKIKNGASLSVKLQ